MAKTEPKIEKSWGSVLHDEFLSAYFKNLKDFLINEKRRYPVYPPGNHIFRSFELTPFEDVRAVLLGQDPYPGNGQAHGLCFSVPDGVPFPPSLQNIFKELEDDLGIRKPVSGDLSPWAKQGVLLLNTALTVRAGQPGSHRNRGWELFTDAVIKSISDRKKGVIFILWGNFAKEKKNLVNTEKHFILTAAHPSPYSCYNGFFGCRHFSKTNKLLMAQGKNPIIWNL
ncbi:MAG: uracil-DNA glycosylase [Bacteroidetes bacterium]|nr:uracil-DNA glycosylase [Bacteroidota bacterium]